MIKRHYKAWQDIIAKHPEAAKDNPKGLLQAWFEKFYGSSSVRISWKNAEQKLMVSDTKKGANAILKTVIGILLKPSSEVELGSYIEQIKNNKAMPANIKAEIDEPMPKPAPDEQPTAAQNQIGSKKTASDGEEYEWKGAQWVGTGTGRIAKKEIAAELGK